MGPDAFRRPLAGRPAATDQTPRRAAMKFTLSWLKEHLQTDADVAAIVGRMTMAGLEVEDVEDAGAKLAAFSVARIVSAAKHPNADKLQVCQVETRDGLKE